MTKNLVTASGLVLSLLFCLTTDPSQARPTKGPIVPITKVEVLNCSFPLSNLSSGSSLIRFRNGENKKNNASIDKYDVGVINGKPVAVIYVTWSTGGTGVFEQIALLRREHDQLKCYGTYDLEDRAKVNSLKIRKNRVILDWVKHAPSDPAPFPTLRTVSQLSSKDFD